MRGGTSARCCWGYGSLAAAMLRFFSGHSSCTAVPQDTMEKPSRDGFTNTNRANLKILRDSSILSLYLSLYVLSLLTCVVLVPLECVRGGASVGCRWGHGSLAPAMRFFSEHSSCTAVPQETMGKPSRKGFTNTNRANLKILRDSSILSLSLFLFLSVCLSLLTCVVLVPLECV